MALPIAVRNPYYIGVLVFVGIYSMITICLGLVLGYAGQISLGHAAFYGIGAYASGLLTTPSAPRCRSPALRHMAEEPNAAEHW